MSVDWRIFVSSYSVPALERDFFPLHERLVEETAASLDSAGEANESGRRWLTEQRRWQELASKLIGGPQEIERVLKARYGREVDDSADICLAED